MTGINSSSASLCYLATGAIMLSLALFTFSASGYSLSEILASFRSDSSSTIEVVAPLRQETAPVMKDFSVAPATTGRLFKGDKIQAFAPNELLFAHGKYNIEKKLQMPNKFHKPCKHWSVLTTIFEPTEAVARQAKLEGWCFVIVGDKVNANAEYKIPGASTNSSASNVVFLNADDQVHLSESFEFINLLPWKSFARKNVGYLYAILNNAESVWDFDDDNILISDNTKFSIPGVGIFDYSKGMKGDITIMEPQNVQYEGFNPYELMGSTTKPNWPRGFPLDHIKDDLSGVTFTKTSLNITSIGIIQALANHDPDVDAIYRLTQPLPFNFDPLKAKSENYPVGIPSNRFTPYNAQATLHLYPSLWSMLLPITVHGRVADIWRGYIFQRLARDVGVRLIFSPAMVVQDRNSHSYLAGRDSATTSIE